MLREERHGDAVRVICSTGWSRSLGYDVSVYAVRGMLIDCAFRDVGPELLGWIRANRVEGVVVTHHHDDHAGNVELLAASGVPMWMTDETKALMSRTHPRGWHRRWCWGSPKVLRSAVTAFAPNGVEMIHTPGHASDHHVAWDSSTGTLYASDLFLGVKVKVAHPVHREDVRAQVASVRRAAALKPARVFDAHRGILRDGLQLLEAKANWIEETVGRADQLIDRGWSDHAIMRELFDGESYLAWVTIGDFSRINFVRSVRATHPRAA